MYPALINNKYYHEFDIFYMCSFTEDNIIYKSIQHYYQSKKVIDPKIQKIIYESKTSQEAFSLGQIYPLRKGWDNIKVKIMLNANKLKFDQNLNLKKMLIETDETIKFPYSNDLWGNGEINILEKILMILRAYYKKENRSFFTLEKYFNFHIDWH